MDFGEDNTPMECCYGPSDDDSIDCGRKIVMLPSRHHQTCKSLSWFVLRVFYVRVSNCEINESTPEFLTLNHVPLSADTLLEVNGGRSIYSEGVSSSLRRDRVDKQSDEATFVCTDSIRMTGSVKFEVLNRDDLLLSGVLDISNGLIGDTKKNNKVWSMNCQSRIIPGSPGLGFLRGKQYVGSELSTPTVEVYVAGSFSGTPVILTKTIQLNFRRKNGRKALLDSIPEYETAESKPDSQSNLALQIRAMIFRQTESNIKWVEELLMDTIDRDITCSLVSEFRDCKQVEDEKYSSLYSREEFMEGEDGELSWFNAGVRVGVGIGLGMCLGIGIGVGLLMHTYQATTRNFKRRLL